MHTALKNLWASVAIEAGSVLDQDRSGVGDLTLETMHGVHRYYPFVVEDRGRLGKSALTVVYIFAVLLVVRNFPGGPSASTSYFLRDRGTTEADMWRRLAEGLLPAYDQPQLSEAATDQPVATPADVLALVGVRAWAEYEANTDADDAIICPPTRTLLALLEIRGFFRCALTARAICAGPLADLELPTVEQLAEAIAATIRQRTNTPLELQHA
eukprot:jgi/Tetstr1/458846/TSEL_004355.t1